MDYWQRITLELIEAYGSIERVAKLAICGPSLIRRVAAGRTEPTYSVGDRLMRMHQSMVDAQERAE